MKKTPRSSKSRRPKAGSGNSSAAGAARRLKVQFGTETRFKVPIPKDEPERLIDLRRYEILDTLPEEEFDNIAHLAAQICQTPIAVISLVDADRQWFKSRVGLSFSETARDIAFCAHAIMQHDLFVVPDASKDRRFADNPLVRAEPKLRFYAGAPLVSADDHALGTLCVMDKVPRELTAGQKEALRVLSHAVMSQLELRRRVRELEGRLREVDDTTRVLRKTTRAARSQVLTRCEFLGKAAHDVRTTAREIASLVGRAAKGPCTGEQGELLRGAVSGAKALEAVADEMRRVSERALE